MKKVKAITEDELEKQLTENQEYKYGFTTDVENIRSPKGLSEETIRFISNIKKEPDWMLEWRLKAFNSLVKFCKLFD